MVSAYKRCLFDSQAVFNEVLFSFQGYDGGPPILLKEEPEDGSRSFQKVPSLSDLSEESLGEYHQLLFYYFIASPLERYN